jgi:hypothetical protein
MVGKINEVSIIRQIFIASKFRIFVSYSKKDRKLAGEIKKCLEEYKLDVFLAHEDITASAEWASKFYI